MDITDEDADTDRSLIRKRTIEVAGKTTSVSLEEDFWDQLKRIANSRGMTMEKLVADIESQRRHRNRSSALRVYALRWKI